MNAHGVFHAGRGSAVTAIPAVGEAKFAL
jgi:hypothetical protein